MPTTTTDCRLIDSHVHTDDPRLTPDLHDVLDNARKTGVIAQIIPAVTHARWPHLKQVCAMHDDLYACYGLHPCFCDEHTVEDIEALALWLSRERPVAIGECGLDYYQPEQDVAFQQHLFDAQLALAREFDLPIVIHARKAVEDVISMIRASGHTRGVVHSYNGSLQQAHRLIDLGYTLSFGGATTYTRAKKLRDVFSKLPLDALMLETDAPDQPDAEHTGQRNEPAWLWHVWQSLSALRPESAEAVAHATTHNAITLFRLPPHLHRHPAMADHLNKTD